MLLSSLPESGINEMYKGQDSLAKMTENSITSLSQLKHELSVIRKRGLSYDDCESNTDARCVSAPIYNHTGNMVAAISISVPISRMTLSRQDELSLILRKGAEEISRNLGYNS
jgi:DNA-binding IclR family transcriptional regulator